MKKSFTQPPSVVNNSSTPHIMKFQDNVDLPQVDLMNFRVEYAPLFMNKQDEGLFRKIMLRNPLNSTIIQVTIIIQITITFCDRNL